MKTFDEIYEELQNENNSELIGSWHKAKKQKEKANKLARIICLILDIFTLIMLLFNIKILTSFYSTFMLMAFTLFLNLIIFVIINALYFGKEQIEYTQKYKKIVINKIIENFYGNLKYLPPKPMPECIYKEPQYNEHYDIYESEDYFEAQINNTYNIQMAEVLTQKEQKYTGSNGKTETRKITKFNGLFAKVVMHKSINSELRIMLNRYACSGKRLQMDSSEFEKYFDVVASDKIIGMQLLTADVMEELIQFENITNMKFDVVINKNELYLRFHCGKMFEPDNFKDEPINKKTLEKYFYMLNFTYNLSNKFINIVNDLLI